MTTALEARRVLNSLDERTQLIIRRRWVDRDDLMLAELIDSVLTQSSSAAQVLAADYYNSDRAAKKVPGSYRATPPGFADLGTHGLVGWARTISTTESGFQSLVLGGVTKRLLNAGRITISDNATADPRAAGWQRVAVGGCTFCRMLASRGAVYRKSTARFASHDHCRCTAAVAFDNRPEPVKEWDELASQRRKILNEKYFGKDGKYDPEKTEARRASKLNTLENDQARVRAWMKDNADAL